MKQPEKLPLLTYVFLAVGSFLIGIVLLFIALVVTQNMGIDITQNLWWLALPVVVAVTINIILVELWERFKK